jgi:hypothetical protein
VRFLATHRAFSSRGCIVVVDRVGAREFGDGIAMALVREVAARGMKIGDILDTFRAVSTSTQAKS